MKILREYKDFNGQQVTEYEMSFDEFVRETEQMLDEKFSVIFEGITRGLPMPVRHYSQRVEITRENLENTFAFIKEWYGAETLFKVSKSDWIRTPKTKKPKAGSPRPLMRASFNNYTPKLEEHGIDVNDSWCGAFYGGLAMVVGRETLTGIADWHEATRELRDKMGVGIDEYVSVENICGESSSSGGTSCIAPVLARAAEYCDEPLEVVLLTQMTNPFDPELRPKTNAIHIVNQKYVDNCKRLRGIRDAAISEYYASKSSGGYCGD